MNEHGGVDGELRFRGETDASRTVTVSLSISTCFYVHGLHSLDQPESTHLFFGVIAAPPTGAYLTQTVHLSQASIRFEMWDTAGQEKYHSVTPLYYRGAHAALVVYDISQRVGRVAAGVTLDSPCRQ